MVSKVYPADDPTWRGVVSYYHEIPHVHRCSYKTYCIGTWVEDNDFVHTKCSPPEGRKGKEMLEKVRENPEISELYDPKGKVCSVEVEDIYDGVVSDVCIKCAQYYYS